MSYYNNEDMEWFEDEEKESALRKRLDELDLEAEHDMLDRLERVYQDVVEFDEADEWDGYHDHFDDYEDLP